MCRLLAWLTFMTSPQMELFSYTSCASLGHAFEHRLADGRTRVTMVVAHDVINSEIQYLILRTYCAHEHGEKRANSRPDDFRSLKKLMQSHNDFNNL